MSSFSDYANAHARLTEDSIRSSSQRRREKGQFWAGTLATLGELPAAMDQQRAQEAEARQRAQDAELQRDTRQLQNEGARRALEPQPVDPRDDELKTLDLQSKRADVHKKVAEAALGTFEKVDADTYPQLAPALRVIFGNDAEFPETYPGDAWRDAHIADGRGRLDASKLTPVDTVNEQGQAGTQFVDPTKPGFYPKPAPKETQPSNPTEASLAAAAAKGDKGAERALQILRNQRVGAGGPASADSDVKLAVQAMKEGTVPPQLPGRASKEYLAVMAEAKRQGYDLAGAATDWAATQKHIATMNGAQQLRLTQGINALPELLDSVEALAKEWKGGRFPLLNKGNLALAKNGAFGDKAASLASRLETQIADVTADLGNVYMGGNSPTDHALELAGTALKSQWSEKVLLDMVDLARKNVIIRRNSINNTGVAGASPSNPYAPPVSVAPPTGRYNPATGKIE